MDWHIKNEVIKEHLLKTPQVWRTDIYKLLFTQMATILGSLFPTFVLDQDLRLLLFPFTSKWPLYVLILVCIFQLNYSDPFMLWCYQVWSNLHLLKYKCYLCWDPKGKITVFFLASTLYQIFHIPFDLKFPLCCFYKRT